MRRAIDRAASYAMRLARVTAYVLVVLVVAAVVFASRAKAALGEAVLDAGEELAKMGDAIGPRNRVRLNGELVNVASAMVDDLPSAVIDRFEAECRARAGGLAEELDQLEASANRATPATRAANAGIGVVRKDEKGRSAVACLARDDTGAGAGGGALGAFRAMLTSGDLSKLGKLRYVTAERAPGSTKTHVVAAWSDGSLRLRALVPSEGTDAPGSDPPDAARPLDSRRLLTASIEGAPYSVRVYDARATPADVLATYDRELPVRGWTATPAVSAELSKRGQEGRAFRREGVDLMIFAESDREPGRSVVSIVAIPPR